MPGIHEIAAAKINSFLPQEDASFGPNNWYYRRMVIMAALAVCGISVLAIALVVVFGMVRVSLTGSTVTYDSNLLRLAEGIIWAMVTLASAIIGSYVFAANWDAKDYRKNVNEMQSRNVTTTVESKVVTRPVEQPVNDPGPKDRGDQPDEDTQTNKPSGNETKKQEPVG